MPKPHPKPDPNGSRPPLGRDSIPRIARDIVACTRCPRLRAWCEHVARTKRRAYRSEEYWGRPIPGFGDPRARLFLLGLAPAAHGANRTGRMFTGDASGDWLFAALHTAGFASQPRARSADDGLRLLDAYIGATARCAPPDNKPLPEEIQHCAEYLEREFALLRRMRVVLCLGQIAFGAALRLLDAHGYDLPKPRPRFAHCVEYAITGSSGIAAKRPLILLASYHPSRQNTQTGRLTRRMWNNVFRRARILVEAA